MLIRDPPRPGQLHEVLRLGADASQRAHDLAELAVPEDAWFHYDVLTGGSPAKQVPESIDKAERRRTLARCMRVCKAFSLPAGSVLWRDLDSVNPVPCDKSFGIPDTRSLEVWRIPAVRDCGC